MVSGVYTLEQHLIKKIEIFYDTKKNNNDTQGVD